MKPLLRFGLQVGSYRRQKVNDAMKRKRWSPNRCNATTGLVLIDPQAGFTRGQWAASYGGDQDVEPILDAFKAVRRLYDKEYFVNVPVLVTLAPFENSTYDRGIDPVLLPWLEEAHLQGRAANVGTIGEEEKRGWTGITHQQESILVLTKRTEDLMADESIASTVSQWIAGHGLTHVVIAGCTTTACVRRSSQSLHRRFVHKHEKAPTSGGTLEEVIVDLSLCGARRSKMKSPQVNISSPYTLDGAIAEMRNTGVLVVDKWHWHRELQAL
jgi:nicotinamidase-related amidase